MRVLIVEDNRIFSELLKSTIQCSDPHACLVDAEDLAAAEGELCKGAPDVVFLDCCLPDGNGLELIERLRRENPDAVVAVCTSYDLEEYRTEACRRGAEFFLPKDVFSVDSVYEVLAKGYCRLDRQPGEGVSPAILKAMEQQAEPRRLDA